MHNFSLISCLLVLIAAEFFWIKYSNQAIALGLLWSIVITGLLLNIELDLVAILFLGSAVAAYLAISLCLLQIGQGETISPAATNGNLVILVISFILFLNIVAKTDIIKGYNSLNSLITGYVDSNQAISASISSLSIIHEFFFSLFIIETLLLNLYITFTLILAIILLNGNRRAAKISRGATINLRLRNVAKLRRQSRRKDGSLVY